MSSSQGENENIDITSPSDKHSGKRKTWSKVWDHFEKFFKEDGRRHARCNYCGAEYKADSKKDGVGNLGKHLDKCMKYPYNIETQKQREICIKKFKGKDSEEVSSVGIHVFDQKAIRAALVRMVIVDELPFRFVEGEGFKSFMSCVSPNFRIPSRWTIARDAFKVYVDEKVTLKNYFRRSTQRVCLTTDSWTSIQRVNYMCLTAHFIDDNWVLQKKILNFCPLASHKGRDIGQAIEKCLMEWEIDRVCTITVDNASSNDVAINYLKEKMKTWPHSIMDCQYLHMRCFAHIINLVVGQGLKDLSMSVQRVRDAVRYVRQSPNRLNKFKECVEVEKIESKRLLCLDVTTRWNSTYLMLDVAQKFERAFVRYEDQDPFYVIDLQPSYDSSVHHGHIGVPTRDDWEEVRKMVVFLQIFYELTLSISGTSYVTSNTFLHEISHLHFVFNSYLNGSNNEMKIMAEKMKSKLDSYSGDVKKMNKLMYIAVVLDPRYKLDFVQYTVAEMYPEDMGNILKKSIEEATLALFADYKKSMTSPSQGGEGSQRSQSSSFNEDQTDPKTHLRRAYAAKFKQMKAEAGSGGGKSELERYLSEDTEEEDDDFDILKWWKVNSARFPVLSQMARDVLAIPISTVASESAFSTGGRVLDAFRSSLTPKVVEALICCQDWYRSPCNFEGICFDVDDFEKMEDLDDGNIISLSNNSYALKIYYIIYTNLCYTFSVFADLSKITLESTSTPITTIID